jgi:hypothetical protein
MAPLKMSDREMQNNPPLSLDLKRRKRITPMATTETAMKR